MKVYCYPVDRNSTYVPLLFTGTEDAFEIVYRQDGSLVDAMNDREAGIDVIVHIHWEEFVLRECRSEARADEEAATFVRQLIAIHARGISIVWTMHNELPHIIPYQRQFLEMRAWLAAHADAILVHDEGAIHVLAEQVAFDRSRVHILPHPSYLGNVESEAELEAGLALPHDPVIQCFGWIRLQKGFGEMIEMLPRDFLTSLGARIRISGQDAEAAAVIAQQPERTDVCWDVRHVPKVDVPTLLRSAACVVLPYERVLTSGVALLAMSAGAMIVAVDIPQLRELLPEPSRRFLYARGDGHAFRAVVAHVFALSREGRQEIVDANLEVARERHPKNIARRLAKIYGSLREHRSV